MKIVVIGGTGLIGSKVVARLRAQGHEVVPAAPSTGIDVLSGEGLDAAMQGTDVVVDLANSPSFDDDAAMAFFRSAGQNVLAAEARAGVGHHLALSVVGTEKLVASGYFRAKIEQERLIRESGQPYTIVHSTQFFEFLPGIIQSAADGGTVRLSPALVQPIASEDVAEAVDRDAHLLEILPQLREPQDRLGDAAGKHVERDQAADRQLAGDHCLGPEEQNRDRGQLADQLDRVAAPVGEHGDVEAGLDVAGELLLPLVAHARLDRHRL
jgi:uncharacterized protein YbjT (DUF2867 family)